MATVGIDGMPERAAEYYAMGIRFAKWRATIKIDPKNNLPTETAIREIAHNLARYGAICQAAGLVPIIEPETMWDGDHDIQTCYKITNRVLQVVVEELKNQKVLLEGMVLKPNMVTNGSDSKEKNCPEQVAFLTMATLSKNLPASVPGVTFLSGGQSEEQATLNLNAMNNLP
jgi:fructose-bisphosphate aldolase class I